VHIREIARAMAAPLSMLVMLEAQRRHHCSGKPVFTGVPQRSRVVRRVAGEATRLWDDLELPPARLIDHVRAEQRVVVC
jgi:hypothetical protein